jgi:hypothetical protein
MSDAERRQHRRLTLRLPVAYRLAGAADTYSGRAVTVNVSTVGTYFETVDEDLREGAQLELALTIPPAEGISPYRTEVFTTGEVLRAAPLAQKNGDNADAQQRAGVAVRFRRPLQYEFPV